MDTLNPQQRRAAEIGDGPVAIIAGPGTGKTKTLTARITYLIEGNRARPQEILALTFTKKAAQGMAARVDAKGVTVCTFHALCHTILGSEQQFISEPERRALIKKLPKITAFRALSLSELSLLISRAKNLAHETDADAERLIELYNAALQARGVIDFDDLLLRTRDFLRDHPAKRPQYHYILVDEFQDTNALQYELLQLLRINDNLFVIGDPNQSIYGFRGASGTIFDTFKADLPDNAVVNLTINYRSTPQIVELSNAIFPDAPQLQAYRQTAGEVRATELLNEYSEAQWVLNQIQQAIGGSDLTQATYHQARRSLRDFAIIYRSRHAARTMQKYMESSGLPYQIVGDGSPYDLPDVQMLIALLRASSGKDVATPQLNSRQIATLLQGVDVSKPPAALALAFAKTCDIEDTLEVSHFIGMLVRFKNLAEAIAHLDGLEGQQFYDQEAEVITLMTIHASKGLEFAHVFLLGAEEGILPSSKGELAEEKRLFYVAATRAKDQLDITYVQKRAGEIAKPSQFMQAIPTQTIPRQKDPNLMADKRRLQKRNTKRAQTTLF